MQVVTMAGKEVRSLRFELPELVGKTKTVYQKSVPSKMTIWTWVGIGAAGALGIGATITRIMATRSANELSDMRFVGTPVSSEVQDQQSKTDHLALTTDILAGAAIVTLGAMLVWTFARPDSPLQFDSEPQAKRSCVRPIVRLGTVGFVGEF